MEPRQVGFTLAAALLLASGCGNDDAPPADDGGTGGSPGPDPFCFTRPKLEFCEDFDEEPLPGSFSEAIEDGCTLEVVSDEAASPPGALFARCQDAGPARGLLRQPFDGSDRLRWFGQVYVEALPEGQSAELGSFELGSYRAGFGVDEAGHLFAFEDAGTGAVRFESTSPLPVGRWLSLRWDVNLDEEGGTTSGLLRLGNDPVVDTEDLAPPDDVLSAPLAVTVGLEGATGGGWAIGYDNITVDAE